MRLFLQANFPPSGSQTPQSQSPAKFLQSSSDDPTVPVIKHESVQPDDDSYDEAQQMVSTPAPYLLKTYVVLFFLVVLYRFLL